MDLIKHVYTPKRLRGSNISYEDVRDLSIAKKEATNTKSGLRRQIREDGKSAIERISDLIQFQIDYLQTAGKHESKPLNFLDCKCLHKTINGEIE